MPRRTFLQTAALAAAIIIEDKAGRLAIRAKQFVDATKLRATLAKQGAIVL